MAPESTARLPDHSGWMQIKHKDSDAGGVSDKLREAFSASERAQHNYHRVKTTLEPWKKAGSYLTSGTAVLATRASCAAAESVENCVGHLMHVLAI